MERHTRTPGKAWQGHGRFTHTKLGPNPAADLSPPRGHQLDSQPGWGCAPARGAPNPNPLWSRSAEPQGGSGFPEAISYHCSLIPCLWRAGR